MGADTDELFLLGVVTGTHGLKGDLKVRPLTPDSASLPEAQRIWLRRPGGEAGEHVPVRAVPHKGNILLRLRGLESIEAVQDLVGCEVLMRLADLAEPDEDEFYWFELEGMRVIDRSRGDLGTLEDLFVTAAHDIYVVRGPFGEILIPAVEEFVLAIDPGDKRMEVDLPEGLVPEPDEV